MALVSFLVHAFACSKMLTAAGKVSGSLSGWSNHPLVGMDVWQSRTNSNRASIVFDLESHCLSRDG